MAETGRHQPEHEGRRLALAAVFEADFGMRTAERALERHLADEPTQPRAAEHARVLVTAVARHRDTIDAGIEVAAPAYPVVQMARIDRALLRCAMGELLHCPTTPARVAIAEWVALARSYSGEPARRLMNGVLGRVVKDTTGRSAWRPVTGRTHEEEGPAQTRGREEGAPE